MQRLSTYRKHIVASFCGVLLALMCAAASPAQEAGPPDPDMDALFATLADPDAPDWQLAEAEIQRAWSISGSPAMDLLLARGRAAMQAGDLDAAIEHLTALTEQAPDFAEGWNARATAYYLAGLFGPSIADIGQVLLLEPRHYGAISGLGMILQDSGREDDALRAFRESLAINPHQDGIRQALEQLEALRAGTDI